MPFNNNHKGTCSLTIVPLWLTHLGMWEIVNISFFFRFGCLYHILSPCQTLVFKVTCSNTDNSKGLASMNCPFQDKLDLVMCSAHNSAHSFLLPVCHHHPFLLPWFRIHPIIIVGMLEHAGAGGRERRKSGDVAQTQASVPGKRRGRVKYMQHTFKHKPGEGRGAQKAVPCHWPAPHHTNSQSSLFSKSPSLLPLKLHVSTLHFFFLFCSHSVKCSFINPIFRVDGWVQSAHLPCLVVRGVHGEKSPSVHQPNRQPLKSSTGTAVSAPRTQAHAQNSHTGVPFSSERMRKPRRIRRESGC